VRLLIVIAVFLILFLGFTFLGFMLFKRLPEPNGMLAWIFFSHIGLISGIYFAKKAVPKKKPTRTPV